MDDKAHQRFETRIAVRAHRVVAMLPVIHRRLIHIHHMAQCRGDKRVAPVVHDHAVAVAVRHDGLEDVTQCGVHRARTAGDEILRKQFIQLGAVRITADEPQERRCDDIIVRIHHH